jgi:hypothetical protein
MQILYAEIYEEMCEQTGDDFALAQQSFALIMYARSPTKCSLIMDAVFKDYDPSEEKAFRSLLLDFCSHFVEYDDQRDELRLAHVSVREYLELRDEYKSMAANLTIARVCLQSLSTLFQQPSTPNATFSEAVHRDVGTKSRTLGRFASYAICHWPAHAHLAVSSGLDPHDLPTRLGLETYTSAHPNLL